MTIDFIRERFTIHDKMKEDSLVKICRFLNTHNINGAQLSVLCLSPDFPPTDISKITEEKLANIYTAFQSLKRRGYIHLEPNPESKREYLTTFTDKGKDALKELAQSFLWIISHPSRQIFQRKSSNGLKANK